MKIYRDKILNELIDKYEKSSVYKGTSQKNIKIYYNFTPNSLKEYFDETNYKYAEEINNQCKQLEEHGLIEIYRGCGVQCHIIKKVSLNLDKLDYVYSLLHRKKKASLEEDTIEILSPYSNRNDILGIFTKSIISKLKNKDSIKKYLDIENPKEIKEILTALDEILKQDEEIFKRVFSIKMFNDSKRFEKIEGKLLKIMNDFGEDTELENLSEYNILDNYSYVYFKGDIDISINNNKIQVNNLHGGLGISSKDIDILSIDRIHGEKLITIENLTSFNNYIPNDEVVIYLGGYHNKIRRELLRKIYSRFSNLQYYHWGDIDVGGFRILNHLREKTGIPFVDYKMDKRTLKEYKAYGKTLTKSDKKSLEDMLKDPRYNEFKDVFEYMISENVKLEQEIIE